MSPFFYAHPISDNEWACGYWPWLYIVLEAKKPVWWCPRFHVAKSEADDIQPPVYYVRFGWLLVALTIGVRNGREVLRRGLTL